MSTETQFFNVESEVAVEDVQKQAALSSFKRIARYTLFKVFSTVITIIIGVYLTILIANMGGKVDEIMRGEIRERITLTVAMNPANANMSSEARNKLILSEIAQEETRLGLNQPFAVRSFRFLRNALTLNLGRAQHMNSDTGSRTVRLIILERLPPTLLLMGTANLLLFFISVGVALSISRAYGTWLDRLVIALSPTSAAPPWFYGIFFILIFAAVFSVLPFGGMVSAPPPETTFEYALDVLWHLILPAGSLFFASIFLSIYNWRTFFLIYSSEDYVDMAKAKGLTSREIERRYVLRPTLPTIITSFALLLIGLWTGAIVTETIFNWPGLGRTILRAVNLYDTPVIVGTTIIYAYLLGITVFLLDFIYALVDPRVKIGGSGSKA